MKISELISLGKMAGQVLNKVLDQLPTHDQRVMKRYLKLLDKYHEEIIREDADFDDLLIYRERIKTLTDAALKELRVKS